MDFNPILRTKNWRLVPAWEREYPNLVELKSIGQSYEKRPIWLLALTNKATGADTDKPAVWIDANIHATEITGTTAAMHLIHTLLSGYGQGDQAARLLDNSVYYVVPRVNPDGAALGMAEKPRFVRSGVRLYPWQERDDGLHEQDVDGDGRILQMRIPDPSGDWKVSELDPRLMQKREPHEHGGTYFRLMQEGLIEDWDGFTFKAARAPEGLDFNRNFPFRMAHGGRPARPPAHSPVSEPGNPRPWWNFIATPPETSMVARSPIQNLSARR